MLSVFSNGLFDIRLSWDRGKAENAVHHALFQYSRITPEQSSYDTLNKVFWMKYNL